VAFLLKQSLFQSSSVDLPRLKPTRSLTDGYGAFQNFAPALTKAAQNLFVEMVLLREPKAAITEKIIPTQLTLVEQIAVFLHVVTEFLTPTRSAMIPTIKMVMVAVVFAAMSAEMDVLILLQESNVIMAETTAIQLQMLAEPTANSQHVVTE